LALYEKMKTSILILSFIFLSGCTSVRDHSQSTKYAPTLGVKYLTADALICKREPQEMKSGVLLENEIVWQKIDKECNFGSTLSKLPKGTEIRVLSIEEHVHRTLLYFFEHWYLIGEVQVEGKIYKFYHFYGINESREYPEWN